MTHITRTSAADFSDCYRGTPILIDPALKPTVPDGLECKMIRADVSTNVPFDRLLVFSPAMTEAVTVISEADAQARGLNKRSGPGFWQRHELVDPPGTFLFLRPNADVRAARELLQKSGMGLNRDQFNAAFDELISDPSATHASENTNRPSK